MEVNAKLSGLASDMPIENPADDKLGFPQFAEEIAKALEAANATSGLVTAIYAPWGAGKTTLLNFIRWYLEASPKANPDTLVVPFNPWWFSGEETLLRSFFSELETKISSKFQHLGDRLKKPFGKLTVAASKSDFGKLTLTTAAAQKSLEPLGKYLLRADSVPDLKRRIAQELTKSGKRIIVFIDDIDRLPKEEIRQLFRMIKAVADFPQVVYLLAFDHDIVADALGDGNDPRAYGLSYLEKIIQAPFELPYAERSDIHNMLFARLEGIAGNDPHGLFSESHWANTFTCIKSLIKTPRDAIRVSNALSVTYPPLIGEVNPVDFIALETIRILQPPVYEAIKTHQSWFVSTSSSLIGRDSDTKALLKGCIAELPEAMRDFSERLFRVMFPPISWVFGGTSYSSEFQREWRTQRRICSSDCISTYFRFGVSPHVISQAQMRELLQSLKNPPKFSELLLQYSQKKAVGGASRVRDILERLQDHTSDDIPIGHITGILSVFASIGDEIAESDQPTQMFEFGSDLHISRITWQLLKRFPTQVERFKILKEAFKNGTALKTMCHQLIVLGQQHGKYGANAHQADERIISDSQLHDLEVLVAKRIVSSAKSGKLLHQYRLGVVLLRWKDWGAEGDVKRWLTESIQTGKGLLLVLRNFVSEVRTQSLDSHAIVRESKFDFSSLYELIDKESIDHRLSSISFDVLDKGERDLVKLYNAGPKADPFA